MKTSTNYLLPAWIDGTCKDCGFPVIITQASDKFADYWYYCSNKECKNHHPGEQIGDQENCSFEESGLK